MIVELKYRDMVYYQTFHTLHIVKMHKWYVEQNIWLHYIPNNAYAIATNSILHQTASILAL